jgi:oxalate decarboxylase/phosphoglucose isomerase-like protein (cupin superfamily)
MSESHLSDIRPPFLDARGEILNLLDLPLGSVSLITSKEAAVRANHYHKTDWHYCWMQKGSMDYYYRAVGSQDPAKFIRVEEGKMVYTPSMEEHAMVFTADAIMWCFAGNPRTSHDYESDTVRVPSIVPDKAAV